MVDRSWRPQFDAISPKQERLAREFSAEISGLRGRPSSPPDPVRLLEMAQALYEAELEEMGQGAAPPVFVVNGVQERTSGAAPAQPLTNDEIDLIAADGMRNAAGGIYATSVYEFARAIEARVRGDRIA